MLGIIKRSFHDLDKVTFLLLYKSLVRSHLEYANSVWCPYKSALINDIEKVQKYATKLIRQCKEMKYKERLKFLRISTLKCRRMRGDMIEVFKIINHYYESRVVPNFCVKGDNRTRGHGWKINVTRCRYDVRKFSFCNRVVGVWNSLPAHVVNSPSVDCFKANLDKLWESEEFYYDYDATLVYFDY